MDIWYWTYLPEDGSTPHPRSKPEEENDLIVNAEDEMLYITSKSGDWVVAKVKNAKISLLWTLMNQLSQIVYFNK